MSGSLIVTLVVEDGSIVADANTYASVTVLRQYAINRGVTTLPVDDPTAGTLLLQAMDYIESKVAQYQGTPVTSWRQQQQLYVAQPATITPQALSWPRGGVYVDGYTVPFSTIPARLIAAQCQLACDASAGIVLMPTVAGNTAGLKRQKIGPLDKTWFDPSQIMDSMSNPRLTIANSMLAPLYATARSGALKLGRS